MSKADPSPAEFSGAQPARLPHRRSRWGTAVASVLILVLGGGIGWCGHSLLQSGIPIPAKENNDPELIAKREMEREQAIEREKHRKLTELHSRLERLKELAKKYQDRLNMLIDAKNAVEREIGTAESDVITLKLQMERKELELAQAELLRVDLDLIKKKVEAKNFKIAVPSKNQSRAGGEDVQVKYDRLLDEIRFLEEYKKCLEVEIANRAKSAGHQLNRRAVHYDAYDLQIEITKNRLRELLVERDKVAEEMIQ
jgi:hypothetical protein